MSIPKVQETLAFLIHRRTYRNNSLLLDFLTRDFGRLRVVGRGVRNAKINLQMFTPLLLSFSGRGELKTLGKWEYQGRYTHLSGDVLVMGVYANELLSSLLCFGDVHSDVYDKYGSFVKRLGSTRGLSQQWSLRLFESQLLRSLGFAPSHREDINGRPIIPGARYCYHPEQGFEVEEQGKLSGAMLVALEAGELFSSARKAELRVCRDLHRLMIDSALGGKPLFSRNLFFRKDDFKDESKSVS